MTEEVRRAAAQAEAAAVTASKAAKELQAKGNGKGTEEAGGKALQHRRLRGAPRHA